MKAIHNIAAINGYGFKGETTENSYINCPINYVFSSGKSISFWLANNSTASQILFTNNTGTSKIYFSSSTLYIDTEASLYSQVLSIGTGTVLNHIIVEITSGNILKVHFNKTEYIIATLAGGDILDFSTGFYIGKAVNSINSLNGTVDDVALWNCELDQNKVDVLYNNKMGISCKAMPYATPSSTGLAYYFPLDNINLDSRVVTEVITGTTCTLIGGKLPYFTTNAIYSYDTNDYIHASDSLDWDINSLDSATNLTVTFIVSSDITYNYPGSGTNYATLLAFGGNTEANVFRVALGQISSSGGELFSLVSVSTTKTGVNLYHPTGGQPTSFTAGNYDIITINISSAGTKFFRNGVKIFTNAGFTAPIGTFNVTQMRLTKGIDGNNFKGYMREISIMTKALTESDIVNIHKGYLGISGTPDGLPSSVLKTTTWDLMVNGGYTIADIFSYWKGSRINGSLVEDILGLILKDFSGNSRNMNLVGYTFPANPSTKRRGDKLI